MVDCTIIINLTFILTTNTTQTAPQTLNSAYFTVHFVYSSPLYKVFYKQYKMFIQHLESMHLVQEYSLDVRMNTYLEKTNVQQHECLVFNFKNQAENGHGSSNLSTQEVLKPPVSEIQQQQQPAALFSSSQLLLRRGLTTLAALLILAVGISVHLLMPLPESSWSSVGNATMDDGNWTTTASPLEQSTVISLTELL